MRDDVQLQLKKLSAAKPPSHVVVPTGGSACSCWKGLLLERATIGRGYYWKGQELEQEEQELEQEEQELEQEQEQLLGPSPPGHDGGATTGKGYYWKGLLHPGTRGSSSSWSRRRRREPGMLHRSARALLVRCAPLYLRGDGGIAVLALPPSLMPRCPAALLPCCPQQRGR